MGKHARPETGCVPSVVVQIVDVGEVAMKRAIILIGRGKLPRRRFLIVLVPTECSGLAQTFAL
jgi:hypothetical protein